MQKPHKLPEFSKSFPRGAVMGLIVLVVLVLLGTVLFLSRRPVGVMVGGALLTPERNIVENLQLADNLTQITSEVEVNGLQKLLSNQGPFTLFAPDDSAFALLKDSTLSNSGVRYHVLPGRFFLQDLPEGRDLNVLNGQQLKLVREGELTFIQDMAGQRAQVQISDVVSSNGIIHVISAVLQPTSAPLI